MELEMPNQMPLIDEAYRIVYPKLRGNEHEANKTGKTFVAEFFIDNAK
jgi:hypothetical protein